MIYKSYIKANIPVAEEEVATIIIVPSSRDENLQNRSLLECIHSIPDKLVCVFLGTFGHPKADLLTLLQVEEAVAVAVTAAVDEGPAGLSLTVKVPAQSVFSTVPLLHWQLAKIFWSCRTHTNTHTHEECAHIDTKSHAG